LKEQTYHGRKLRIEVDDRDIGGSRGWDWIKKGIPLRVEIGPRDIAEDSVFVGRRDKGHREKVSMPRDRFVESFTDILDEIQDNLFARALAFREAHTQRIKDKKEFYDYFTPKNLEKPEIHGGFAVSPWCGGTACEAAIKEDLKVTIRCIPFGSEPTGDKCICCGKPESRQVIFAKAY